MNTEKTTRRISSVRRNLFRSALCFGIGLSSPLARASLTVTPVGAGTYNLAWDAEVDPADVAVPPGVTTYRVCAIYGIKSPFAGNACAAGAADLGTTPAVALSNVQPTIDPGVLPQLQGRGAVCFGVLYIDASIADTFDRTTQCHSYLHNPGLTNNGNPARVDGSGGQLGFGQQWNFTYFLDDDANFSLYIYNRAADNEAAPTGGFTDPAIFTANATGFMDPIPNAAKILKKVVDQTPRSGEQGGGWSHTDQWDCRDSNGAVVPNGLYFAYFRVENPLLTGGANHTVRYTGVTTIPVDILRVMNLKAVGVSASNATGSITYDLTGDATVSVVVAKPGSHFVLDDGTAGKNCGNVGDILPADPVTNLCSNALIASTSVLNKKAGVGLSVNWCGRTGDGCSGSPLAKGIYPVAISAVDGFGNRATDAAGTNNNGQISTTLTLDLTAPSVPSALPALTVNQLDVGTKSNVPLVQSSPFPDTGLASFSSLVVYFTNPMPLGAGAAGEFTLTGPGGAIATDGGVVTAALPNQLKITPTVAPVAVAGNYQIAFTPSKTIDQNTTTLTGNTNFGFQIDAVGSAVATQTADQFKNSVITYPNPSRGGAPANIDFNIVTASTVDFDIFTLTGSRLFHKTQGFLPCAGACTFPWSLVNDAGTSVGSGVYLVRVTARNGANVFTTTRKVMIIR